MPKSIRIRTEVGQNTSKHLNIKLEQDFDFLEILSLKLLQNDIYIKQCSDYGVVVGRVLVNNGYGIPNAKISVFIPLDNEDETNPIISALYPYKSIDNVNEDGYRYNLLPYEPSYPGHKPTGTFPSRHDALTDKTVVALYDKYYKFTVQTNESGDFMIFGVPTGIQTLVMDVDLSDIGEFSLSPQDLIRIGLATPSQVDGTSFKTSENLNTLPQIINVTRTIEILPFWGDPDTCQVAITRTDFDLGLEANLEIQPTAIFMGSLISTPEEQAQKTKCRVNKNAGNQCSLVSGPGQIKAIRQTIFEDDKGRPALEPYNFEDDGNVIDENGTWLLDVPMNLDYITTDEFGQRIISNDPKVGVPSSAKYRFKIKWQQQPTLSEPVKRGYFLVPNIREYGWEQYDQDPSKFEFQGALGDTQELQFAALPIPGAVVNTQTLSVLQSLQSKAVVKVSNKINVADYTFIIDGVATTLKDNIIIDPGQTLQVTVTFEDTNQPIITASMFFNIEPYLKYQVERSYSFSLSWDDYAEEQTAINCEDTFYEMRYNKVYTVSQLMDQYRKGFSNAKFLGVKDITDESCQSTSNPFPTNDAQYKTTFLYLLFSFLILIFRPTLFALLIISHVVAFILKYLIFPLVIIIAIIYLIVILICNIVNGISQFFGGNGVNCPDFGDLRDLVQDILQLWKKMIIRLPNLTYPDCEICDCIDEDAEDYEGDQYASQAAQLTKNAPAGTLFDFTNIFQYKIPQGNNPPCSEEDWDDDPEVCQNRLNAIQVAIAGAGQPPYAYGGGNVFDPNSPTLPKKGWFSTGLPIAERVNLWNAKAKYFNNATAGEGYNRIKVSFQPGSNEFHYDNVIIVFVDSNQLSQYQPGQLLAFQDSSLSQDLNVLSAATGVTSVTGLTQITLPYADFNDPTNTLYADYTINITGNTQTQFKFPMDIEYFQVIKTTTVGLMYQSGGNGNGFIQRCLLQNVFMNYVNRSSFIPWNLTSGDELGDFLEFASYSTGNNGQYPFQFIEGWPNIGILIMVRGVDPNTPKIPVKYEIGRLYGQNENFETVEGDFHPNIPIQGGYKCVRHNEISNNDDTDTNGQRLYFKTFNSLNIIPQNFQVFDNKLHQYYLKLDGSNYLQLPEYLPGYNNDSDYLVGRGVVVNSNGIAVINNEIFAINTNGLPPNPGGPDLSSDDYRGSIYPNVFGQIRVDQGEDYLDPTLASHIFSKDGYQRQEKVEGCSFSHLSWGGLYTNKEYGVQGVYHSRKYSNISTTIQHSPQGRYVMRSDRLPTSTYNFVNGDNHMALQQNTGFAIFKVSEDGTFASSGSFVGGGGYNGDDNGDNVTGDTNAGFVNEVLSSFTCGEDNSTLVPFGCYKYSTPEQTIYIDDIDTCTRKNPGNVQYFKNNCYQMVTKPIISIPVDVLTILEWLSRAKVFFGLCQGVFRHMFTNSWINGTLFAFSFKNDRFFDTRYNRPYNKTCEETVYFHRPTNNFFYRSSPFKEGTFDGFIGRETFRPGLGRYYGGNMKNLMFPTTIMDLGPRDEISKFLNQSASEEYEGYIVNKIPSTTFNEIDDILNLFVISRLANTNFLEQFFGVGGASILNYFTRERSVNQYYNSPFDFNVRNKNMVDADYAQMISINSEFGIVPFDEESYPQDPNTIQQETIYFNGDEGSGDAVVGIFFSSFTQNRDFISPKRIVYSPTASLNANNCNLNPIPVRDQLVPFYQWAIPQNNETANIFGTQKGHWYTVGLGGQGGTEFFHNHKYQSLDRLTSQSRFFRTTNPNQSDYYKGYIYSVDLFTDIITADPTFTDAETYETSAFGPENVVTAGGPFFFYFGLNRGASAMDRFITKWVDTETTVD